jgi:hypothetical protein
LPFWQQGLSVANMLQKAAHTRPEEQKHRENEMTPPEKST